MGLQKRKFNFMLAALVVFLLPGCAAMSDDNYQQAVADVETKYERLIESQPILYLLESKIMLTPQQEWTLDKLADRSLANDSQKEAIAVFDRIVTETNAALMELEKKRGKPAEAEILSDWIRASKDNRLALYQDKISFGVFNQNCKTLSEVMQSLNAQLSKETAQKAHKAWVQAFQSWSASLEENQPVTANCIKSGEILNCSGY